MHANADLANKIENNEFVEEEVFADLTAEEVVNLAPVAVATMSAEGRAHVAGNAMWNAATEYGLENLPSDFLRVLYKHYFSLTL